VSKITESEKESDKDPNIIQNIESYIETIAGNITLKGLINLNSKLIAIKGVIETSYQIGDYIEKYEAYKKQMQSTKTLQIISNMMLPEIEDFIAAKFKQLKKPKEENESKSE
jgi:hypothetical protein